jgi:hypothetical protein
MAILDDNDTAGFYKYESESLTWGKWVLNLDYELYADKHTEYELPVDGWYWFDSIQLARQFFNIPEPTTEEETDARLK